MKRLIKCEDHGKLYVTWSPRQPHVTIAATSGVDLTCSQLDAAIDVLSSVRIRRFGARA